MDRPDAATINDWLVRRVAAVLEEPPEAIDPDGPITELALSSLEAVTISGELGEWLGASLSPLLVYQHGSIRQLAAALAGERS